MTLNPEPCFTCEILAGRQSVPGECLVWESDLITANHHGDPDPNIQYASSRAGWIVVTPVRHVTRVFEVTHEEWDALGEAVISIDAALTELYGSKRTLVASLGWNVTDHVHVHCVPTFGDEVTLGYENFESAYVPVPYSSADVAHQVKDYLLTHKDCACDSCSRPSGLLVA